MRLRSSLMMALKEHIGREGLTQSQAAKVSGVMEPRVSDLIRGKIELFGLDSLVNMAAAVGGVKTSWGSGPTGVALCNTD